MNSHGKFDCFMPHGGFKELGWRREHGSDELGQYLEGNPVCTLTETPFAMTEAFLEESRIQRLIVASVGSLCGTSTTLCAGPEER